MKLIFRVEETLDSVHLQTASNRPSRKLLSFNVFNLFKAINSSRFPRKCFDEITPRPTVTWRFVSRASWCRIILNLLSLASLIFRVDLSLMMTPKQATLPRIKLCRKVDSTRSYWKKFRNSFTSAPHDTFRIDGKFFSSLVWFLVSSLRRKCACSIKLILNQAIGNVWSHKVWVWIFMMMYRLASTNECRGMLERISCSCFRVKW